MIDPVNPVPIYLTSLELENVRCFGERQRLDLCDENGRPVQWVLILGDNGVGKTTLLQCLAWMRPVISYEPVTFTPETEPALNSEENKTWDALVRVGTDVTVNVKATLSIGQNFDDEGTKSISDIVTTKAVMRGTNGQLQQSTPQKHSSRGYEAQILPNLAIFGYGAARRPGTLKLDPGDRSDPLTSLFQDSAELYDAEDILLKLDHRAAKPGEQQDIERLRRVKEVLATVLLGIEHEGDIEIYGPAVFSSSAEPSGVRFRTPYGLVPLSALSLGYQTTLTWIVDLALRLFEHYPESPDPLSEPGIVLIDNIDLHLHPRWQRRVMENLSNCFRAIQFVATAHSPLIVQAADGASIAALREQDGQVLIEKHSESVNAWRADQILASDIFENIPTRGPSIEKLVRERDELLNNVNRSPSEEKRLEMLIQELETLPTAADPEDRAAMDLIRSVAAGLRENSSRQS